MAFGEASEINGALFVSDDETINRMSLWDVAFARPSKLVVCLSENFDIEGIQMTSKVYAPDWEQTDEN